MTAKNKYPHQCHFCGKFHPMAWTPFPMEEGWPCPYNGSREAYIERVGKINPSAATRMKSDGDLRRKENE